MSGTQASEERLARMDMAERVAARKVAAALDGLTAAERRRALLWAYERFVPPHQRRSDDTVSTDSP